MLPDTFIEWVFNPENLEELYGVKAFHVARQPGEPPHQLHAYQFSPAIHIHHENTKTHLQDWFDEFMRKDYYAN